MMAELKKGDVVRLKGGNAKRVVQSVNGDRITCAYEKRDGTVGYEEIDATLLETVEKKRAAIGILSTGLRRS